MILAWIRFILSALFILTGLAVFILSVLGVYRFDHVLNRMHVAATGDTMGIFCVLVGCMILSGWNAGTLKMLLIIVLFWMTSPVCSHVLCNLEIQTNEKLEEECEVEIDEIC